MHIAAKAHAVAMANLNLGLNMPEARHITALLVTVHKGRNSNRLYVHGYHIPARKGAE